MPFLRQSLIAFKRWLANRRGTEEHSGTPDAFVTPSGHVARFVFRPRDLYTAAPHSGLPRPGAFHIDRHPESGRLEVSVCGLTTVGDNRLWQLGRTIRQKDGLSAIAALRLGVEPVANLGLACVPAPELPDFAEHAVIVGWPPGDDNKSARQDLQNGLAAMVAHEDVLRPPEPIDPKAVNR